MKIISRFLLLATLYSTTLLAQAPFNKDDIIIHARMTRIVMGNNLLDIEKRGDRAEIIYKLFDSIPFAEVRKDTAYIRISKNLTSGDTEKLRQLKEISDSYAIYKITKTSVDLKTDTTYSKILELLRQTSKQELETSKIGKHIYLDEFGFSCEIITTSGIKNIGIHNPTAKSHPIVAALLEESYDRLWKTRQK